MKEVVGKILRVDRELKSFADFEDSLAIPAAPATDEAIQELRRLLNRPIPPSYVQLLRLHDGIENFYWVEEDLVSTTFRREYPDYAAHWEPPDFDFFVIGDDWEAVAFDMSTQRDDGEMEVVEFLRNVERHRWSSLSDFLRGYLERMEDRLIKERADRALLDDDDD